MNRRQFIASLALVLTVPLPVVAQEDKGPDLRLRHVVLENGTLDLFIANFERLDVRVDYIRTGGPQAAWTELNATLPAGKVTVVSIAVEGIPSRIELRTSSQVILLDH